MPIPANRSQKTPRPRPALAVLLSLLCIDLILLAGCDGAKAVKTPGAAFAGNSESKSADQQADLDSNEHDPEAKGKRGKEQKVEGGSLIKSKFALDVKALGGSLCAGEVEIRVNAAITKNDNVSLMQIPSARMKCKLIGEMDLGLLLKGLTEGGGDGIRVNDGIIQMASLGAGTFTPPHLFMPSFIASSRDAIESMNAEQDETVKTKDGKAAAGHTKIETLSFNDSFTSEKMGRTFKDVIHFRVTNTGYEGIERMESMLFNVMEFKISLNPLAILSIRFLTQADDILVAGARAKLPGTAGKLIEFEQKAENWILIGNFLKKTTKKTEVDLTMELIEQADLDKNKTIDDEEVIGD